MKTTLVLNDCKEVPNHLKNIELFVAWFDVLIIGIILKLPCLLIVTTIHFFDVAINSTLSKPTILLKYDKLVFYGFE
jgi:hypothetical protein